MSQPIWADQQRDALRQLSQQIADRQQREQAIATAFQTASESAHKEIQRTRKSVTVGRERELTAIETEHRLRIESIEKQAWADLQAADQSFHEAKEKLLQQCAHAEEKNRTALQDALWTADSLLEAGEKEAQEQRDTLRRKAAASRQRAAALREDLDPFLDRLDVLPEQLADAPPLPPLPTSEQPLTDLREAFAIADDALAQLAALKVGFATTTGRIFLLTFGALFGALPGVGLFFVDGLRDYAWIVLPIGLLLGGGWPGYCIG